MPATFRSLARKAAPGFFIFLVACPRAPVASVNGQAISSAELEAQLRVYLSVQPGASADPATRRLVLDQLLKQALLMQAARREGLDKDPAFKPAVDRRRAELRQQLQQRLEAVQAQLATLDEAVEAKALIDAYVRVERPGVTVTPQELRAAYDLRVAKQPLPPFQAVRDQLLEQVVLDRLAERERSTAVINIDGGTLK